jgi:hypothetical protein
MNMKLATPNISVPDWNEREIEWLQLNADFGNLDFYPLTIKAAYVIGVIHGLCESVSILLRSTLPIDVSLFPAYSLFASSLDLLGRCLNGSDGVHSTTRDLRTGFNWIAASTIDDKNEGAIVATTAERAYTVGDLIQLRHFTSHGQATAIAVPLTFDPEVLQPMPALLASGLEKYWNELQAREDYCNKLASANILAVRSWPIFKSWSLFERQQDGNYESMTAIFAKFDWRPRVATS